MKRRHAIVLLGLLAAGCAPASSEPSSSSNAPLPEGAKQVTYDVPGMH